MSLNKSVPSILTWATLGLLIVNGLLARRVLGEYRGLKRLRAADAFSRLSPKVVATLDGYRRDGTRIAFPALGKSGAFILFQLHATSLSEDLAYWRQVGAAVASVTNVQLVAYCDTLECAEAAEIVRPGFEVAAYCSLNLSRTLTIYDKQNRFIIVDSSRRILADLPRAEGPAVVSLLKQTIDRAASPRAAP